MKHNGRRGGREKFGSWHVLPGKQHRKSVHNRSSCLRKLDVSEFNPDILNVELMIQSHVFILLLCLYIWRVSIMYAHVCSCIYYMYAQVCTPHLGAPGDVENLPLPLPPFPIFFQAGSPNCLMLTISLDPSSPPEAEVTGRSPSITCILGIDIFLLARERLKASGIFTYLESHCNKLSGNIMNKYRINLGYIFNLFSLTYYHFTQTS